MKGKVSEKILKEGWFLIRVVFHQGFHCILIQHFLVEQYPVVTICISYTKLFHSVCALQGWMCFTRLDVFHQFTSHLVFCPTGKFKVNNVSPQANGESSKVKVKVRINGSGIFGVSGATMYEKLEGGEEEKEESMDVDGEEDKKAEAAPVSNGAPEEVRS